MERVEHAERLGDMDRPHATVVLEIFSGRPDPSWKLDAAQTAELRVKLLALPPAHERTLPPEPGLGYRGLHVSLNDRAHGEVVEVRERPDRIRAANLARRAAVDYAGC